MDGVTLLRGEAPARVGYGDGYGYGFGRALGNGDYWLATIDGIAARWPDAQRRRLAELRDEGHVIAFWRSDTKGLPSNGGTRMKPAAPGVIHKAPGPILLCEPGTLHATINPQMWRGERVWIVAMIGPVEWDDDKVGALKREIIGEVGQ